MLNGEEILEMIDATEEEREMLNVCRDRILKQADWEATKAEDPEIPRQRRYPGPTAAEAIPDELDRDPKRFIAFMEALRIDLAEHGVDL